MLQFIKVTKSWVCYMGKGRKVGLGSRIGKKYSSQRVQGPSPEWPENPSLGGKIECLDVLYSSEEKTEAWKD